MTNTERHIRHNGTFIDASFENGAFNHYVTKTGRFANAELAKRSLDLDAARIAHRCDYTNGIITNVVAI